MNDECVTTIIKDQIVEFYPESHTYYVDGVKCISATQIATYLNPFRKMKIPEHVLRKAGLKGTVVHDTIEHYLTTGEINLDENCKQYGVKKEIAEPYFNAFLDLMKKYGDRLEILHIEKKAIYPHDMGNETVVIVGTIDIVAKLDGELIILDWKTSSAMTLPEWRMQLSIYQRLVQYTFDMDCPKRYIGWLKKNGSYELVEIAPVKDSWLDILFNMLHPRVRPIIDKFNLLLYEIYGEELL